VLGVFGGVGCGHCLKVSLAWLLQDHQASVVVFLSVLLAGLFSLF